MKRLQRTTLYTAENSLDTRVQALERRIFTVPTDWAVVELTTPVAATSGGTVLTWNHFRTSSSAFSTSLIGGAVSNTAGDEAIRLDTSGVVLMTSWAQFENGTFYRKISTNGGGGELDPISNLADIQSSVAFADDSVDTDGSPLAVNDEQWFTNSDDTIPAWFSTSAFVGAAQPDMNVISASMTVVLFQPSGVAWIDTAIY